MVIPPERPASASSTAPAAARAVRENHTWYHTIELGSGVVTPGQVDLRRAASRLLPDDLGGKRCLDVGTFDGFWAFEMERRGADVIAIDVGRVEAAEWPPLRRPIMEARSAELGLELGRGFRLASQTLGSRVRRVVCSVYDLRREAIDGPVDFAFAGSILVHLRDPVAALERVRDTLADGGELRGMEPCSLSLTLRSPRRPAGVFCAAASDFTWWLPNLAAVRSWPAAAGFARTRRLGLLRPPARKPMRNQVYAGYAARR
jgi:tRNA (mo5U34)-methyltransferase